METEGKLGRKEVKALATDQLEVLESTFAVDRPDALAVPDITEMALLTTIAERRRSENSGAFPAIMPHTIVGNSPGVLGAQAPPQRLRRAVVIRRIDGWKCLPQASDVVEVCV